jgi:hypothetical protein
MSGRQNADGEDDFSPTVETSSLGPRTAHLHHLSPTFCGRQERGDESRNRCPLKTKPGILGRSSVSGSVAEGQADEPECREPACCWAVQEVSLPVQALVPATHLDDCTQGSTYSPYKQL